MIPYWLFIGVFAFAAALSGTRTTRHNTPGLIAAGLLITLVVGLRYGIGGDWMGYERIFRHIGLLDFPQALRASDPAYGAVNWLAAQFGLGIWAVNLVCAAVFSFGLIELSRDQPNPALALVVAIPYLVIVLAMGYTRQGAALGMVMAALPQYFRGKMFRVAVALVLAAAFHKSAIVMAPILAIASSRQRVLTMLLLGTVGVMIYYLFVVASVDWMLASYVEAKYSASGAAIRISMNLVPATIFLLWRDRFGMERDQRRFWIVLSLGSFVSLVMLLATPSSTAVDRMSLYLIPLQVVVLSRLPYAFPSGDQPSLSFKMAVIGYSVLVQFVWLNFAQNARDWLPYRNYLTASRKI